MLFVIFFVSRFISFLTVDLPIVQALISIALLFTLASAFFFSRKVAWTMLMTELLLGGAGQLFSLSGISLRSLFFIAFFCMWLLHRLQVKSDIARIVIPKAAKWITLPLLGLGLLGAVMGIVHQQALGQIIADTIPYAYLLLIWPAYAFFQDKYHQQEIIRLILVSIFSSAIWSLILYILFATGLHEIHDPFYNWIRDVLAGKITDLGNNIFRIVFPAHLLILPWSLLLLSLLMRDAKHHLFWRIALLAIGLVFVLNMSRAYALALFAGSLCLLIGHTPKQWGKEMAFFVTSSLVMFFALTTISAGSLIPGLSIAGLRVGSFVSPQSEVSTYTRTSLLSPIFDTISTAPLLGVGSGSQLSFTNPITGQRATTTQYDWGWFEIMAELGIIGFLLWASILGYISYKLWMHRQHDYPDVTIGLLAGIIGLSVATIFGPVLTHVLGIVYLTLLIPLCLHHAHVLTLVSPLLAKVFSPKIVD